MKKIILSLFSAFTLAGFTNAQTLTQSNFTCTIIPQVMGSGTSSRLPVIIRATVSGLAPNTTYRYFTNLAAATDFGTTNSGAGNPLFPRTSSFVYTTGASLATANNYDSLTSDASGNFTGWFAVVNTGNTRFTAGNYVYPSIVLDSAGSKRGVVNTRLVATDSILVLGYSATAGANNGTGIRGNSSATDKNIILLYDNINGAGRPLSICFVETMGTTIASAVPFYTSSVQAVSGAWGTIVPNTLPNGVKRIEQRSLTTGAIVNANTSSNSNWGSINTVNPAGGTTALTIAALDAPLPVTWKSFTVTPYPGLIQLDWTTASETSNSHFEIQRSDDGKSFETIGSVTGEGNSNTLSNYTFVDAAISATNLLYYRLKQVDLNGQTTFSNTITVNTYSTPNHILACLPNPFAGDLNLSLRIEVDALATISITDALGETHHLTIEQLHAGSKLLSMHTSGLPAGVYVLRITFNGETISQKIVKE
jgi:hypothetical protein